jgi:zinc/manganese transport system substrate-binding protein
MNVTFPTLAVCLLGPLFAASAPAKLNIVSTTPDFGALAREVGGDRVDVTTLAKPTEDPHFVDAKPSFVVKLNRADALLEGGAELETGWLPPLLEGARNARLAAGKPGLIRCSDGVTMLEIPKDLDRSKGDLHGAGNPHFMTDPLNGRALAARLAESFAQLDPAGAEVFRANVRRFQERLDERLGVWQKQLAPHKGRPVVSYHNSWLYFARRFDLKMDLFLEPKPGIPPSPAHLADVVARMKQSGTKVIVVEPFLNRRTADNVAGLAGATVVVFPHFPGGARGVGDGYIEWMDHLVGSLAKALDSTR